MTIMIPAWQDDTLVPVEKLEAHEKGMKHKAISVFVVRDGQVLIQQRAMGKYHTPGLWANTCCTHPNWDETSSDCANRRLNEELGISGLELEYRDRVEYRADVGNGLIEHEVVDIFLAQAPAGMTIKLNPEEVMATKWISYPDLMRAVAEQPNKYTPWLRIYLDTYAERIFSQEILARA